MVVVVKVVVGMERGIMFVNLYYKELNLDIFGLIDGRF